MITNQFFEIFFQSQERARQVRLIMADADDTEASEKETEKNSSNGCSSHLKCKQTPHHVTKVQFAQNEENKTKKNSISSDQNSKRHRTLSESSYFSGKYIMKSFNYYLCKCQLPCLSGVCLYVCPLSPPRPLEVWKHEWYHVVTNCQGRVLSPLGLPKVAKNCQKKPKPPQCHVVLP